MFWCRIEFAIAFLLNLVISGCIQPLFAEQWPFPTNDFWFTSYGEFQRFPNEYDPENEAIYMHPGLDIIQPAGTEVLTVAAGTIRMKYPCNQRKDSYEIEADAINYTVVLEDDGNPPDQEWGWGYTHIGVEKIRRQLIEQSINEYRKFRLKAAYGRQYGANEPIGELVEYSPLIFI